MIKKKIGKILMACVALLLLSSPLYAGNGPGDGTGNDGNGPQDGTGYGPGDCTTEYTLPAGHDLLARGGNGGGNGNGRGNGNRGSGGYGPGDGTGNGGDGPKDGTGYGPGDCTAT